MSRLLRTCRSCSTATRNRAAHGLAALPGPPPQWQSADPNVLVVFSGPHAYISPSLYEADDVVPTWNYVAVHVYGRLRIVNDDKETLKILREFVLFHERSTPSPWVLPENDEYVKKLAQAVVAFRIEISRIEGKWKLSQNQPRGRRERVIDALTAKPDESSQMIAALMAKMLRDEPASDDREPA